MRGIAINFDTDKPTLDLQRQVTDFSATTQNALVNLVTQAGSDPIYPDRGTDLAKEGVRGLMHNRTWANRRGNYAALETLNFMRQTEIFPVGLQNFRLQASRVVLGKIEFLAQAVSTDGETIGQFVDV